MKKVFSFIIVSALLIMFVIPFTAIYAAPASYNIPKAAEIPVLDGVIDANEWANALVVEMKKGDTNLFVPAGDLADFEGAVFRFMWTEEGIWFAAAVTDSSDPGASAPASGGGSYNQGDGVQFNIYANRDLAGTAVGDLFFFSYNPKTSDGTPAVGEHFVYGTGGAGADVPEAKIVAKYTGTNYVIEGLIPAAALVKSTVPIKVVSGAKIYWNNVVMFSDGSAQGLIVDNNWFDGALASEYVLVDTLAGKVPVIEEEAEAEEAVVVGPAVTAPATVSPQTGDALTGSVLLILASAAVITYVSKKRKV